MKEIYFIMIERYYYNDKNTLEYLRKAGISGEPVEFSSINEAQSYIYKKRDDVYYLDHNEYDTPSYYIVDSNVYNHLEALHDDNSEYDWGKYEDELDEDGFPVDDDVAYWFMLQQDIEYVRQNALNK